MWSQLPARGAARQVGRQVSSGGGRQAARPSPLAKFSPHHCLLPQGSQDSPTELLAAGVGHCRGKQGRWEGCKEREARWELASFERWRGAVGSGQESGWRDGGQGDGFSQSLTVHDSSAPTQWGPSLDRSPFSFCSCATAAGRAREGTGGWAVRRCGGAAAPALLLPSLLLTAVSEAGGVWQAAVGLLT